MAANIESSGVVVGLLDSYQDVLVTTTREDYVVTGVDGFHITLKDDTGEEHRVIDAVSQVGANPFGHRFEPLLEKIRPLYQEDNDLPLMIAGNDYYHPYQKELAEKFTEIYPGNLSTGELKTYYCNSGSEAVERGCLKAAQLYKGGNTWMSFNGAFHGRTGLALSLNFSKAAHTEHYNFLQRVFPVPFPMEHPERFGKPADYAQQCLDQVKELIMREGADNISAFVAEPIQGEGGYIAPPRDFHKQLSTLCQEYDIPLVMDEVQSSLRTGHFFASDYFDVEPSMIPVAKAFSGGVEPFGAALIKDEYANTEAFGKQSSTFGGNPKECFVALKTIELIQENNYLENARKRGKQLAKYLEDVFEDHEIVKDHRGAGLMRAVEIQNQAGEPDAETRDDMYEDLIERGVLLHPCGHDEINPGLRFLLPVNIGKEEIDTIGEAVTAVVADHA